MTPATAGQTGSGLRAPLLPAGGAILAIGVCCGLIQVVLVRQLLIVCAGSELTVGLILGVWMLGGALGVLWGGRRARGDAEPSHTAARVVLLSTLCLLTSVAAVSFIRVSPEWLPSLPGGLATQRGEMLGLWQTLILTLAATLPAVFTLEAAFGASLAVYGALRPTANAVPQCYAIDAAGHLVGGGAAAYLLTFWLDPHTAVAVGGLLCIFAAVALWSELGRDRGRKWKWPLLLFVAIAAPLVLLGTTALEHATLAVRWRGHTLLEHTETLQSNIAVLEHDRDGRVFFVNGVPAAYTETMPSTHLLVHFTMIQHPQPTRVLLVGGLGTGAVDEVLAYSPDHVDYFELDPGLLEVYERHRGGLPPAPVEVHRTDLRAWLRAHSGSEHARWDAIILALPSPLSAVVNRHYTRECFSQLLAGSPNAVVGLHLPGTQTYYSADLLRLNVGLLDAAAVRPGSKTVLMPGDELMAVIGPPEGGMTSNADLILERLANRGVSAPYWESLIFDLLEPMNVEFVEEQLAGYPQPPLNTDDRPISYFHNQVYALKQMHPRGAGLLDLTTRMNLPFLLAAVGGFGLLLAVLVWFLRSARFAAVPVVVAGTGFVGMVLQLAIIYSFQIHVGQIYSLIGLLSGAFMVGLALGGLMAAHLLPRGRFGLHPLVTLTAATALVAVISFAFTGTLGVLVGSFGGGLVGLVVGFVLLSVLVGGLVGVQFPAATEAVAAEPNRGPAASAMYAADLAGGSLGAVLAGAVLVPVLGVSGCGLLCGVAACALACVCVARLRTH